MPSSNSNAVVLGFSDYAGSNLLSQKYQHQKRLTIRNIELKELFSHLAIIQKLNHIYQRVDWQSSHTTRAFNLTKNEPPMELNVDSVISILQIEKEKYAKNSDVYRTQLPQEFPTKLDDLMKKLIRLTSSFGELKVFHWYEEYQCHVGGWEKRMNAFGVDGIFLLAFDSEGVW